MKIKIIPHSITVILLMSSAVHASDYNSHVVSKSPGDEYTKVEYGSGWYLRGDIGYSTDSHMDVTFDRAARAGDANASLEDTYSFGGGFGYVFNDYFRSDLTVDFFSDRSWSGSTSGCGTDAFGVAYTGECSSSDRGSFDATSLSLNAYVNLGHWGRFSPYFGGGIGFAHVDYSSVTSALNCTLDPGEDCDLGAHSGATANPETLTGTQSFSQESSVNLVYTLTAGFDYRLDENWKADFSYRYTDITDGTALFSGADYVNFEGAQIHEVRAGLRYELW